MWIDAMLWQRITANKRWGLALLFWLVGCAPAMPLIPTRMSVAVLPTLPAAVTATVTATYIPSPTATATATPSPTPTATPIPTNTPIPDPIPAYRIRDQIVTPFLETPPRAVACAGSGAVFRSQFYSDYGGRRYYTAYLPPCYGQQGRAYPVLYLFHGSVQTDSHWVELGLPQLMDAGIQSGAYPPFIVIMPFNDTVGNNTSGGDRSVEGITLNALIPFIDAHYCTWAAPQGRSLGGISRGGYWALMIAFRQPHLFASVSGHSSHLRLETDKAEYNPLATYAEADLSRLRIWLDWGEKDFLYFGQKTLHESLLAAGIAHDARLHEGRHNTAYWLAHLQEYLDWHATAWPPMPILYPACGQE